MKEKTYKHINHPAYITGFLIVGTLLATCLNLVFTQKAAHAASAAGFNSGNIIDDFVFTNKNTMNPDQIQVFFNSKVPVCDTWGTQPSELGGGTRAQWGAAHGTPAPFTCIKDYYEGGYSAAQIIHNTAQEFSINPQVLIVLLQKEQGLITDTWPTSDQYRKATGYGCPDSSPSCDANYRGFTNQVRWAARMYRAIMNDSPSWFTPYELGSNYIRYSPTAGCGGSNIFIENRATQSLYNYTPYQPNQASLNAGYGQGDGCSSHGNRNFYLYFIDWFGTVRATDTMSPHPDGTVVAINDGAYLIQSGTLHLIKNGPAFESNGFRWRDIKAATTGDKNLSVSWPLDFIQPGMLYTGDPSGVYVTVYENNQWTKKLVTYAAFTGLGYRWDQVKAINSDFMPTPTSSTALTAVQHPDGTLINDNGGVYLIDHGTRRYVNQYVFESQRWDWNNILPATDGDKQLPLGAGMLLRQGAIISDSTNLYVVKLPSSGPEIKQPIGPWSCYNAAFRYNMSDVVYMTLDAIPAATGANVTCQ